jgi:CCR4-NOT transcription complex subunit 6
MADGQYRFQPGAGQFFQHFNPQHTRHLQQQRPGSPASSSRVNFSNDTPSPSRSPGPQSPAHPYNMYNQNHASGHGHALLNGTSHSRYNLQMNINKQSFHHTTPQTHGHHNQAQHAEHNGHNTHQTNYVSHQHNQSGGGGLSNAANHFTPAHMQNGTPNNTFNPTSKPPTEHWAKQMERAQREREMTTTHPHARNASSASKSIQPGVSNGQNKDGEKEERFRSGGAANSADYKNQTWFDLDMGGSNLRVMGEPLFTYKFLTRLYINNNKLQSVPSQIGKLRNLVLLDLSLNELTDLPPQMGMLVNLKELLLFDNSIQNLPFELGNLYQLEMLGIEGNPLNEELKSIIMDEDSTALIRHLRENAPGTPGYKSSLQGELLTNTGPPPPNERDWIELDSTPHSKADMLSVLSFNILCDKAATQSQFGYTPSFYLSWDVRKDAILNEIHYRDADIVCLQEMDSENYHTVFRENLAHKDYKGIFWARTRSKTMSDQQIKSVDGCATFYKNSKYILLDKQVIDFASIAINRQDMKADHDVFNRVMIRDNIAVVLFLEDRKTGTRLISVNVHIFWDEVYKDVKLVQVAILMQELSRLAEGYAKWPAVADKDKVLYRFANGDKASDDGTEEEEVQSPVPSVEYPSGSAIPMVICGDFNSKPDSGVYDLITSGNLISDHPDLQSFKYGDLSRNGMSHPFNLKSSYSQIGELPFTNYTPGFTDVIDYIMFSANSLQVTALLGEVDADYLQRVPGFPNQHFPSDHLALHSQFVVKRPKEARKQTEVDFGPQKERRHH